MFRVEAFSDILQDGVAMRIYRYTNRCCLNPLAYTDSSGPSAGLMMLDVRRF
jgi:hypothetical protein